MQVIRDEPIHLSVASPTDQQPHFRRVMRRDTIRLTTETVKSAALSLEGVDNIERGDCLALGVFCVGDGIADDTLEEGLENTTGLLVDHSRDTLDTATTSETADGGLGDTLDVVAQNLPVTLGTALSETLATFSAWKDVRQLHHGDICW